MQSCHGPDQHAVVACRRKPDFMSIRLQAESSLEAAFCSTSETLHRSFVLARREAKEIRAVISQYIATRSTKRLDRGGFRCMDDVSAKASSGSAPL